MRTIDTHIGNAAINMRGQLEAAARAVLTAHRIMLDVDLNNEPSAIRMYEAMAAELQRLLDNVSQQHGLSKDMDPAMLAWTVLFMSGNDIERLP